VGASGGKVLNVWLKAEAWSNGRISARATPGIRRAVFLLVVLGVVGSSPRAIIRYAEEEPYHSGSWWRNTRDALDVSREVFGLMNV
jgi:hypothetical protein